jgi:hypothetical protein
MKKTLALLIGLACLTAAQAQSTTNVVIKATVEVVTAGVTNSTSSTLRYDAGGSKRDIFAANGLISAFGKYRANAANTKTFDAWLKQEYGDHAEAYGRVYQQEQISTTAAAIQKLMTQFPDLLSNADLNNLTTIAAKAP